MGMECEGCGLGEWYSSVIDKQVALLKFKNREREYKYRKRNHSQ